MAAAVVLRGRAVLPGAEAAREGSVVSAAVQPEPVVAGDAAGAEVSRGTVLAAEAAWAVPAGTREVAAWVVAVEEGRAVAEKSVGPTSSAVDHPRVELAATS